MISLLEIKYKGAMGRDSSAAQADVKQGLPWSGLACGVVEIRYPALVQRSGQERKLGTSGQSSSFARMGLNCCQEDLAVNAYFRSTVANYHPCVIAVRSHFTQGEEEKGVYSFTGKVQLAKSRPKRYVAPFIVGSFGHLPY